MSKLGLYAKSVGAAVVAGLSSAIAALADGHIDTSEWIVIATSVLVGLGAVWAMPEFPVSLAKYLKAMTSGLVSGLASFGTFAVNGHLPTQAEWITIAVAVVIGTGLVHVQKNAVQSETLQQTNPVEPLSFPDEDHAEVAPVEEDFTPADESDAISQEPEVEVETEGPLETK